MSPGQNQAWMPPGHLRPPDDQSTESRSVNGLTRVPSGSRTPQMRSSASEQGSQPGNAITDPDPAPEEDPRIALFRELYKRSEAKINALFRTDLGAPASPTRDHVDSAESSDKAPPRAEEPSRPPKRPARKIDDDDYDDYDDEGGSDEADEAKEAPLKVKPPTPGEPSPSQRPATTTPSDKESKKETSEDIRKKLEEDKKANEEAARRSFHTMFYTLENDRDAMLDQQRLEESERLVEAEMSGQNNAGANNQSGSGGSGYGSLSNANLGASSLTLKNLIARIDMKRSMVQASDAELRSLMSEVRKNRSKWASEDKIGQEELYEAAEKVLNELKAMTEHSAAFLTRVNKRDAPDYYNGEFDARTFEFQMRRLTHISDQTPHGSWDHDKEAQSFAIQVQAGIC